MFSNRFLLFSGFCLFMPVSTHAMDAGGLVMQHPGVQAAEHAFCASQHGIRVQRAGYLPQVDFKISSSDKTVDETTRSDAFGGENSPEYDGHGLDAELNLTQNIYDWGKTGADVSIAKAQRNRENIIYQITVEEHALKLVSSALLHESQSKAVRELDRNVSRLQANRKAIAEQVRLGYTGRRVLNDYDLLLLDRETARDEARFKQAESAQDLKHNFDLAPPQAAKISANYMAGRPATINPVAANKAMNVHLLDEEIGVYRLQSKRLTAQNLPRLQARVSARGWDLDNADLCSDIAPSRENCQTHDVVGALEVSMPLYSGGAHINQKRAILAKKSEVQARRSLLLRRHEQENATVLQRFSVLSSRLQAQEEKADLLSAQLKIEKARQKTNAIRFDVIAELDSGLADARIAAISIEYELEIMRGRQLLRAGQLRSVMKLSQAAPNCGEGGK